MNGSTVGRSLGAVALALAFAVFGGLFLLFVFSVKPKIGGSAIAGLFILAGAYCLGNFRLLCLWGLMLTAPLELYTAFKVIPHMGGETGFRIELPDVFLFPLFLFLLRDLQLGRRLRLNVPSAAKWWIALGVTGLIQSAIFARYQIVAVQEAVRMTKSLVLFLVVANELVRPRQFQQVSAALLVGLILNSLVALAEYVNYKLTGSLSLGLQALGEAVEKESEFLVKDTMAKGEQVFRPSGLVTHPNLLATYIAMIVPLAVAMLFARVRRVLTLLCWLALLVGFPALFITGSRGGWVCTGVSFLVALSLTFKHAEMRRRNLFLRAALLGLALLGTIAFSGPIVQRLTSSDPGAVSARWEYVDDALRMIQARPIVGHGMNAYTLEVGPYTKWGSQEKLEKMQGKWIACVHNVYLLIFVEQGIIGLSIYLAMMLSLFLLAIRNLGVKDDVLYAINIAGLAALVAISIDGIVSMAFRLNNSQRVVWIVAGLLAAVHYADRRQRLAEAARASR